MTITLRMISVDDNDDDVDDDDEDGDYDDDDGDYDDAGTNSVLTFSTVKY